MLCPKCNSDNLTCIDSRPSGGVTRRRRMCLECRYRFSTIEIIIAEYNELKDNKTLLADLLKKAQAVSDALNNFRGNMK